MAASVNPAQLSPKVKWAAIWGVAATVGLVALSAFLEAITPEHLEPLGIWAGPVGAIVTAIAMLVAAYRATDPLRQNNALTLAAYEHKQEPDHGSGHII